MEKYTRYKDQKIFFKESGKGVPLVLLHGYMETSQIWNQYHIGLSGRYRVISVDLPGHGKTGIWDKVHTMEFMADVVHQVLKTLQLESVVLIGHSMGGYVSMAFAEKYGDFLAGLGLFHSHAYADNEDAKKNREKMVEAFQKNHAELIATFIPNLFYQNNQKKFQAEIKQLKEQALSGNVEGYIAATYGMKERKERLKVFQHLNCPVLFIIGQNDPRTPLDKLVKQIGLPKVSDLLLLKDVGHMGFIEAKKTCMAKISGFVELCE